MADPRAQVYRQNLKMAKFLAYRISDQNSEASQRRTHSFERRLGGPRDALEVASWIKRTVAKHLFSRMKKRSRVLPLRVAYYRGQGTRRLTPGHSHLESPGHHLLMTNHGPLHLLETIGTNRSFEELVGSSSEFQVGDLHIRILDLDTLIEVKEETGQAKDKAVLELLRKMLKT